MRDTSRTMAREDGTTGAKQYRCIIYNSLVHEGDMCGLTRNAGGDGEEVADEHEVGRVVSDDATRDVHEDVRRDGGHDAVRRDGVIGRVRVGQPVVRPDERDDDEAVRRMLVCRSEMPSMLVPMSWARGGTRRSWRGWKRSSARTSARSSACATGAGRPFRCPFRCRCPLSRTFSPTAVRLRVPGVV